MNLKDKVVIISGAGRGLGRSIALAMALEGARIVMLSRTKQELKDVKREIEKFGGNALTLVCDVADSEHIEKSVNAAIEWHGRIDILVNNAAIIGPAQFPSNAREWQLTIDTNLTGCFNLCRLCLPFMPRGSRIINIVSGLGQMAYPRFCAYAVSKAGLIQLTRSMAEEFKDDDITINAIDPGVMDTAMQTEIRALGPALLGRAIHDSFITLDKEGFLKSPADVAELAVFLASDKADHISGQIGTLSHFERMGWKK